MQPFSAYLSSFQVSYVVLCAQLMGASLFLILFAKTSTQIRRLIFCLAWLLNFVTVYNIVIAFSIVIATVIAIYQLTSSLLTSVFP